MRINRLQIHAFGKLQDRELCFTPGLNLIYGPNESGKSTLMAFLRAALYGFNQPLGKNRRIQKELYEKYRPWFDHRYGGWLELDWKGQQLRIYHDFNHQYFSIEGSEGEVWSHPGIDLGDSRSIGMALLGMNGLIYDQLIALDSSRLRPQVKGWEQLSRFLLDHSGMTTLSAAGGRAADLLGLQHMKNRSIYNKRAKLRQEQIAGIEEKLAQNLLEQMKIPEGRRQLQVSEEQMRILRIKLFYGEQILRSKNRESGSLKELEALEEIDHEIKIRRESLGTGVSMEEFRYLSSLESELQDCAHDCQALEEQLKRDSADEDQPLDAWDRGLFLLSKISWPMVLGICLLGLLLYGGNILPKEALWLFAFPILLGLTKFLSPRLMENRAGARLDDANLSVKEELLQELKAAEEELRRLSAERGRILEDAQVRDIGEYGQKTARLGELNRLEYQRDLLAGHLQVQGRGSGGSELDFCVLEEYMGFGSEEFEELKSLEEDLTREISVLEYELQKKELVLRESRDLKEELQDLLREEELQERQEQSAELAHTALKKTIQQLRQRHEAQSSAKMGRRLSHLTMGRYDELIVDGEQRVFFREPKENRLVPVEQLSAGTMDQAYLSILLSSLDGAQGEKRDLPLLLDDALVQWDDIRLERMLQILQEESQHRQILLFTCTAREWEASKRLQIQPNIIELVR